MQFIGTAKFMPTCLSNLVNNRAEEIHKIKCKYEHDDKNAKRVELNTKTVSVVLNMHMLRMI